MWTLGLGSKFATLLWTFIIACFPMAAYVLGPKLLFSTGSLFGYYLRKKTAGRRAQILDLVESEEKEYLAENGKRRDSDDWEEVEAYATASSNNGEKADKDWDGIVGFFHPFWYVADSPVSHRIWSFCQNLVANLL